MNTSEKIIKLSRFTKNIIIASCDYICLFLAMLVALFLFKQSIYMLSIQATLVILITPIIAIPIFIFTGLYLSITRFIGFRAFIAIFVANTLYSIVLASIIILTNAIELPVFFLIANLFFAIFFTSLIRIAARWFLTGLLSSPANIVIYGAGNAGSEIASAFRFSNEYKPVAFIDDDVSKQARFVGWLKIFPVSKVKNLIKKYDVKEIFIAIPSISVAKKKGLMKSLEQYPIKIRILPSLNDLAKGEMMASDLEEIKIEELLMREPVQPKKSLMKKNTTGKTVMITGAGGSIGSELCRQIVHLKPKQMILFERSEFALYKIEQEMSEAKDDITELIAVLGSVLDKKRLEEIFKNFQVDTIYHAAAYKHVPLVEANIFEGIKNNIFGTLEIVKAAINFEVETFIFISTDKAVRPISIMGMTKRFSEIILQALADEIRKGKRSSKTKISMVRFGNVLGSSGSVVNLFREQIENGGPVTVTDPNVIRYFMTTVEAAQLVIQAGAISEGGDVFLLDMGEPIKIIELAKQMILKSGLTIKNEDNPTGDIEIVFTGLRPGEKLYEELLIDDKSEITENPKIMRAEDNFIYWSDLEKYISKLWSASMASDSDLAKATLVEVVKN